IREQTARVEAEAANKAKDRFLATLSHELRTPLTPVLFASSMLSQDQTVPDHVRQALDIIARNVQLEARLIDDLLDVTRIGQGKFTVKFEDADVHELLRRACEICLDESSEKEVTVQFELEAGLLESDQKCSQVHNPARQNHAAIDQSDHQLDPTGSY